MDPGDYAIMELERTQTFAVQVFIGDEIAAVVAVINPCHNGEAGWELPGMSMLEMRYFGRILTIRRL